MTGANFQTSGLDYPEESQPIEQNGLELGLQASEPLITKPACSSAQDWHDLPRKSVV